MAPQSLDTLFHGREILVGSALSRHQGDLQFDWPSRFNDFSEFEVTKRAGYRHDALWHLVGLHDNAAVYTSQSAKDRCSGQYLQCLADNRFADSHAPRQRLDIWKPFARIVSSGEDRKSNLPDDLLVRARVGDRMK